MVRRSGRPTHQLGSGNTSRQIAVVVIVVVAAASPAALMLDHELLSVPGLAKEVPDASRAELQAAKGNHPQQVAQTWSDSCRSVLLQSWA